MRFRFSLNILIPCLAVLVLLGAHTAGAGILTGQVTNPSLAGVPNVKVEFIETATGTPFVVANNITDPFGNYGVLVPDGVYDVEFVTPVISGGVAPVRFPAVSIVGTVTLNVAAPWGKTITGFVFDTLGLPVDGVDLNVADASSGTLDFTPNDNTDIAGAFAVIVTPGLKDITFAPTLGQKLAPTLLTGVDVTNDTTFNVSLAAGVFVSGTVLDNLAQPVVGADLDFDQLPGLVRVPTPGDKTLSDGTYQVTVPRGTYDINIQPAPSDGLVSQLLTGVPINNDTVIDWTLTAGWNLSGTVTGPGGPVINCDIDVIDTVTLAKLVTPGDKTDVNGFFSVIVPPGDYYVNIQPLVSTRLAPTTVWGVHVGQDTSITATVVSGVILDGTITSPTGAAVDAADLDLFDAVSGATIPVIGDLTDASGYFAMVVVPNTFNIEYEPPKARRLLAKKVFGVTVSADLTQSVVLDSGLSVSGTITAAGVPVDSVDVDAIVESTGLSAFLPKDMSDALGNYEVVIGFVPHTLVYYPPVSSGLAAHKITGVNPPGDIIQNVALSSGFLVSGTITEPGGATVSGVALRAEQAGNWIPSTNGTSDASGAYQSILPGGTYDLIFIPPPGLGLDTTTVTGVTVSGPTVVNVVLQTPNQAPVLAPIGPQAVIAESNLNFVVTATDADSPAPSLTATGLPANATFTDHNNGTGTFDFNPTLGQIGSYFVTFEASDGSSTDSEIVRVSVIDPNCNCPLQGDFDANSSIDAVDLGTEIDAIFFGGTDVGDPSCPTTRGDFNADGSTDAVDLGGIIDHIFFGGPTPTDPCIP